LTGHQRRMWSRTALWRSCPGSNCSRRPPVLNDAHALSLRIAAASMPARTAARSFDERRWSSTPRQTELGRSGDYFSASAVTQMNDCTSIC
jgi:Tfp pilus assembly protein PilV